MLGRPRWAAPGGPHSAPRAGPRLKVALPGADVRGIMAEVSRTPSRPRPSLPDGLLAALTKPSVIRLDEVARARRHVADRTYDNGHVAVEVARQLLSLSVR